MSKFLSNYITEILIGLTVAIIGAVFGAIFRIYKKKIKIEKEYNELATENKVLKELLEKGGILGKLKLEVDAFLTKIINKKGVKSVSLYIPYKNSIYNFETLPINITSIHHKSKVLNKDTQTIVGQSFHDGEIKINKLSDRGISDELNRAVDAYNFDQTECMATIPYIERNGEVSFILQIISDLKLEQLDVEAQNLRQESCELYKIISQIFVTPGWENLIPQLQKDKQQFTGSVLFFDLANSSVLLEEFPQRAEDEINNFIKTMCNVAIKKNGEIDKYTGDGGFITFNLKTPVPQHSENAVETAIEMVNEMNKLREIWRKFGLKDEIVNKLKIRVGVSTGEIRPFKIGHPDYQYLTYIGKPIHTAYHLCEGDDPILRDRILIDGKIVDKIKMTNVTIEKYDPSNFSKSVKFAKSIYEIKNSIAGIPGTQY